MSEKGEYLGTALNLDKRCCQCTSCQNLQITREFDPSFRIYLSNFHTRNIKLTSTMHIHTYTVGVLDWDRLSLKLFHGIWVYRCLVNMFFIKNVYISMYCWYCKYIIWQMLVWICVIYFSIRVFNNLNNLLMLCTFFFHYLVFYRIWSF